MITKRSCGNGKWNGDGKPRSCRGTKRSCGGDRKRSWFGTPVSCGGGRLWSNGSARSWLRRSWGRSDGGGEVRKRGKLKRK